MNDDLQPVENLAENADNNFKIYSEKAIYIVNIPDIPKSSLTFSFLIPIFMLYFDSDRGFTVLKES